MHSSHKKFDGLNVYITSDEAQSTMEQYISRGQEQDHFEVHEFPTDSE